MKLNSLFKSLADVFDSDQAIELFAREALLAQANNAVLTTSGEQLPESVLEVMADNDAHPVCKLIASIPFCWAPPQTSTDPLYVKRSLSKVHVELIGPAGVVKSDNIRLGLYGMLPKAEYGIRTHPAEETYVMLAGSAYWKRGSDPYSVHGSGERSYHPSMMEHATRTGDEAFMSIYVWRGDISTDNYVYAGVPTD